MFHKRSNTIFSMYMHANVFSIDITNIQLILWPHAAVCGIINIVGNRRSPRCNSEGFISWFTVGAQFDPTHPFGQSMWSANLNQWAKRVYGYSSEFLFPLKDPTNQSPVPSARTVLD